MILIYKGGSVRLNTVVMVDRQQLAVLVIRGHHWCRFFELYPAKQLPAGKEQVKVYLQDLDGQVRWELISESKC